MTVLIFLLQNSFHHPEATTTMCTKHSLCAVHWAKHVSIFMFISMFIVRRIMFLRGVGMCSQHIFIFQHSFNNTSHHVIFTDVFGESMHSLSAPAQDHVFWFLLLLVLMKTSSRNRQEPCSLPPLPWLSPCPLPRGSSPRCSSLKCLDGAPRRWYKALAPPASSSVTPVSFRSAPAQSSRPSVFIPPHTHLWDAASWAWAPSSPKSWLALPCVGHSALRSWVPALTALPLQLVAHATPPGVITESGWS